MGKYTQLQRAAAERQRRFEQRIDENCRVSGHGRPATRREFLARGLIAGTATVFLPSIATLLAREVYAQTGCQIDTGGALGAGKIPFLAIDQAGGANIAGSNVMVGKAGGQLDFLDPAGYAKLGLPAAIIPQTVGVDTTFGLAMHPKSALLRGLLSKTSAGTRASTNGFVVPARWRTTQATTRTTRSTASRGPALTASSSRRSARRTPSRAATPRRPHRWSPLTCDRRRSAAEPRQWGSSAAPRTPSRTAASRKHPRR